MPSYTQPKVSPPRAATTPPSEPVRNQTLAESSASRGPKRVAPSLLLVEGVPPASKRKISKLITVNPPEVRADRLGTLVSSLARQLQSAESWEDFVLAFRGRSYLAEDLDHLNHPAADLLRHWRDHGVPAQTSAEAWTDATKDSYVERGCHHSASEQAAFLREEMAEFIESRFWVVLPYRLVRHLPQLQLSPAAVKEERQ